MQLSTLLLNSKKIIGGVFILLSVFLSLYACTLDAYDPDSESESESGSSGELTASTKFITLNIPGSIPTASRAVEMTDIEEVRVTMRLQEGKEKLLDKEPQYFETSGVFSMQAEVPVNTGVVLEAVGFDSEGVVIAYGKRSMEITNDEEVSATISLVLYHPTNMPIVEITEIQQPPAAAVNSQFNLSVSGYVLVSSWPLDPDGTALDCLNLDFNADINSNDYELGGIQLEYDNATEGKVYFDDVELLLATDSAAEAVIVLSSELSPGGTLESSITVPLMSGIQDFTAVPDSAGEIIDLSWSVPSDSWFDGVVLTMSSDEIPQTYDDGTIVFTGDADDTSFSHEELTNGVNLNYAIFPFADESGVKAYGPGVTVSAAAFDGTPPNPVTGLSATESSGTVSLTWSNPSTGYDEIKVIRKSGSVSVSENDASAVLISSGTLSESCTDSLGTAGTYYYSVYAKDSSGNCSSAMNVSVVYSKSNDEAIWGYNTGELTTVDSKSVYTSSKYADTWVFTLTGRSTVTIAMDGYYGSASFDTYLYLYSGSTPSLGNLITYNDDSGYNGYGLNSKIIITLDPGIYSIEASHFGYYTTGDYRLYLAK